MKRSVGEPSRAALLVIGLFLLGALPASCAGLWMTFDLSYGSASSTFGLENPYFVVPVQGNTSADLIFSTSLEYDLVQRVPFALGLAVKGAFGLSSWNLGVPPLGVTVGSFYYPYDQIHVGADWWGLAGMGTMHILLGRFLTWDVAVGYGPYGYFDVGYYDDVGAVSGPLSGGSSVFPSNSWSIDWSTGFSVVYWRRVGFFVSIGSMGPDFITSLGVKFAF